MQLLQCLSLGLNYWLMQSLSWRWLYLELVYDLCGGDIAYYMMEYSYIVDITQEHDRWVWGHLIVAGSLVVTSEPLKDTETVRHPLVCFAYLE